MSRAHISRSKFFDISFSYEEEDIGRFSNLHNVPLILPTKFAGDS